MEIERLKYLVVRRQCETITPDEEIELYRHADNTPQLKYYLSRLDDPEYLGDESMLVDGKETRNPLLEQLLLTYKENDSMALKSLKDAIKKVLRYPGKNT
jgi:hypothetical protein